MERFLKICNKLNLGELVNKPVILTGGFMHKMYGIATTKGKYAVKLLNPYVMKRESAKENYRIAEELEAVLEQHSISILPALTFDKRKMQEIDGQFFYIFDWYEGKALHGKDISKKHCVEMGKVLAKIHNISIKEEPYKKEELHIDWNFYLDRFKEENLEIYKLLKDNISLLYESQDKGNEAIKKIPNIITICHNDMDCKNVLWNENEYRIIDLECLSYASPVIEMYELALCWSGYEECNIDFSLFKAFIKAYLEAGGFKTADGENLYYSNNGRLEWLEYNMKRVLGIECDISEKEMGISEVFSTMKHVIYYDRVKEDILDCLKILKNSEDAEKVKKAYEVTNAEKFEM